MSLVDKYTNVLDYKKEAVVTTPLSENKLLTSEKVTKSEQMQKITENITKSEEVFRGTDEVHKRTENITTNVEVDKGNENFEDMKEEVVPIFRKDSNRLEGWSKVSTERFNLDYKLFKRKHSTLEPDFYKNIYEKDIEGLDMEPYKKFSVQFDYTKLNLNNTNNPVKNIAS